MMKLKIIISYGLWLSLTDIKLTRKQLNCLKWFWKTNASVSRYENTLKFLFDFNLIFIILLFIIFLVLQWKLCIFFRLTVYQKLGLLSKKMKNLRVSTQQSLLFFPEILCMCFLSNVYKKVLRKPFLLN